MSEVKVVCDLPRFLLAQFLFAGLVGGTERVSAALVLSLETTTDLIPGIKFRGPLSATNLA